MRLNFNLKINHIKNFFSVMLLCSFTIFTTYTWGRYAMLACILAIGGCEIVKRGFKLQVSIRVVYFYFIVLFMMYIFMNSLWAIDMPDTLSKGKTLLEIFFMVFVLYNCFDRDDRCVPDVLSIIKWSSYIIVIYSIIFYGVDELIKLTMYEERMQNSYANVNTIGVAAAVGVLIQIDELIREKKVTITTLLCIPAIFLIAVTQSRKAFIIILVGIVMVLFMRSLDSNNLGKMIIRMFLSIIICGVILNLILSMPLFSGVLERMNSIWANYVGTGQIDNSTRLRSLMIEIGWQQFLQTPVLGIGIGNSHVLAASLIGKDAYLHNNFIELLVGGGIIGFSFYYGMYVYLFMNFWKLRKYKNDEYIFCFSMMLILFLMDYGLVSYYSKINYIYLMLYFLEIEQLKKKACVTNLMKVGEGC